jgi:hypothetical protein
VQKYVGTGAYVPQYAQKALTEHMQKTAPAHMQQYAGAYVQQQIVTPGTIRPDVNSGGRTTVAPAPLPDKLNMSHSGSVSASQYEARFYNNLFTADQPGQQFQPGQQPQLPPVPDPYAQPQQGQQQMHPQSYDFIMSPSGEPPKRRMSFGSSMPMRILAVLVVVLVLVLAANMARSFLSSGSSNSLQMLSVAQDQQSIIHLTTLAQQQKGLSTPSQNFTVTAELSLTSQQAEHISYMQQNHIKVKSKQLGLKVDPSLDTRLTDAAASGNLDATYKEVMTTQLNGYKAALQDAYQHTPGPIGRKLLSKEFDSANLLLTQLNST